MWVLNMGNTIFCERLHEKTEVYNAVHDHKKLNSIPSPECFQILIKLVFSFSHGILHASDYSINFGSWGIISIKIPFYIDLNSIY